MKIGMIADSLAALPLMSFSKPPPRLASSRCPWRATAASKQDPRDDVAHRAWNFVTLGCGYDEPGWRSFCRALVWGWL
jgi:hypothetical protein